MSNQFGENLEWFLSEIQNSDKDQIEDGEIDIYGETESGADCSTLVKVSDICGSALHRIKQLEGQATVMKVLLGSVTATEFEGIKCKDIEGAGNWFDARDAILINVV